MLRLYKTAIISHIHAQGPIHNAFSSPQHLTGPQIPTSHLRHGDYHLPSVLPILLGVQLLTLLDTQLPELLIQLGILILLLQELPPNLFAPNRELPPTELPPAALFRLHFSFPFAIL